MERTHPAERTRDYYNLDMILAMGYRVRSNVGILKLSYKIIIFQATDRSFYAPVLFYI